MSDTLHAKSTPRDVFLYLLVTVALYAIAVSAISLLFQYVNTFFPDPLTDYYYSINDTLRRVLSILIIVTPVYAWILHFLNKDLLAPPEKHTLGIRRWLVHLTLFISGVTIIIDLVTLVYNFLGGDLTARFFLKIAAVLVVATAVFAYYIWDIRRDAVAMTKQMRILGTAALVVVAGLVIGGFFLGDSPKEARARRLDDRRVQDLWSVQSTVESYWGLKQELPETLAQASEFYSSITSDPGSGAPYEYRVISETDYELCTTFTNQADAYGGISRPYPIAEGQFVRDFSGHVQGRDCFERSISHLIPEKK